MGETTKTSAREKYDFAKIRKEVDDLQDNEYGKRWWVRACLDVLIYYDGSFKANAKGLLAFYQEALTLVGPSATYALLDGKGSFRKATKSILEMFPFWLTSRAAKRAEYGLTLESGERPGDVSDRSFQMFQSALSPGFVRLVLPLEFILKGPDTFSGLVRKLAMPMNVLSGYAGFAVNVDSGYASYLEGERIYAISRRYLGIDFGQPHMFANFMPHGIKCVNWITILGDEWVTKLGGVKKLSAALDRDSPLVKLDHGVMIQAGDAPRFGAVNRREDMSAYRRVGGLLKDVRVPDQRAGRYDEIGGTENTQRWLHRFD
jgi:hypothetical protein